jgi:hypothetical protein
LWQWFSPVVLCLCYVVDSIRTKNNSQQHTMRYRKLRIAWSVAWGVVAILLIVLWVRSYWWGDVVHALDKNLIATSIGSNRGELYYSQIDWKLDVGAGHSSSHGWHYQSLPPFAQDKRQLVSLIRTGVAFRLGIAHWVLILLTSTITAIPWLPWRFSLRTLLIATALVAVLLGLIVWSVR